MHPVLKYHCDTGHFSRGYLLVGDREKSRDSGRKAAAILLNCDIFSLDSHPDFWEQFFEFFGPEESKILRQKLATKPIASENKVFLLEVNSFDIFAASSISKILENSPETFYFFFMAAFAEIVPMALRSNLVNLTEGDFKLSSEKKSFYEKFLKANPAERLTLTRSAVSDKKNALEFFNELEIFLSEQIKRQPLSAGFLSSLEDLQKKRQFLFDRAPSIKMIIEHISLTLPQLK
jgi:hypothetical protein